MCRDSQTELLALSSHLEYFFFFFYRAEMRIHFHTSLTESISRDTGLLKRNVNSDRGPFFKGFG